MTTIKESRVAVANLRRNQFWNKEKQPNVLDGPKYPVPYIADDPNKPVEKLNHGDIVNTILNVDGDVICQVCGDTFDETDTTVLLISEENSIRQSKQHYLDFVQRVRPTLGTYPRMETNGGPVHLWCARVSLRFCPKIKTDTPTDVVAWVDPASASFVVRNHLKSEYDYGGTLNSYVNPDWLITLAELDELIAEARAKEDSP